ncbi:hypothetical protein, partial [Pantoea sp. CTOTU49201]|uniref:hypothetical protein n=1 Tax=Pantoea sp. CTOTU49201 TaxID=2953855 RepID=UPI0028989109
ATLQALWRDRYKYLHMVTHSNRYVLNDITCCHHNVIHTRLAAFHATVGFIHATLSPARARATYYLHRFRFLE